MENEHETTDDLHQLLITTTRERQSLRHQLAQARALLQVFANYAPDVCPYCGVLMVDDDIEHKTNCPIVKARAFLESKEP